MRTTIRGALRASARLATLALATMLVACGGGGDGSSETPITYDNHLPLQTGDRRVYSERSTPPMGWTTMRVSTETVFDTLQVDGTTYHFVGTSGWTPVFGQLYAASASSIRSHSTFGTAPPLDLVRFPTYEGASFIQDSGWSDGNSDQDGDGKPDPYNVRVTTSTVGVETVSTPAGEFSGALHIHARRVIATRMSGSGADSTVTDTRDTWYVPGVGRVRWEARYGEHYFLGELMGHVPAGRPAPDQTPPVLLRAGPPQGTALHPGAPLVLTFDEPVTDSVPRAVTVTDSEGRAIHLNAVPPFDPTGRSVNLSAWLGWGQGIYTVKVAAGIEDVAGNKMAALPDRTFTVSSDFALVYASPLRLASDVSHWGPLSASTNEPIDRSTLASVRLRENGAVVPATVSIEGGSLVQVTPTTPLKPSKRYTIDLDGLRSDSGLALVNPQDWTFTTAATLKASPAAAALHPEFLRHARGEFTLQVGLPDGTFTTHPTVTVPTNSATPSRITTR